MLQITKTELIILLAIIHLSQKHTWKDTTLQDKTTPTSGTAI